MNLTNRAQYLKTGELPQPVNGYQSQQLLVQDLESISNLPGSEGERPPIWKISNVLRVFGWTHIYNVPYLLHWMDGQNPTIEQ